MRIHYLQHVPFEGPAAIEDWANENQHGLTSTLLYNPQARLPQQADFDMLVVMGGPMGVHDTGKYSWLADEKQFITETIDAGKAVLGICLGAQLIASALGAEIKQNPHREIGWFPLIPDPAIASTRFAEIFNDNMLAFHWHGDTFELPEHALPIASSQACKNQGFVLNDRVVALQFHLETTVESAGLLIENCSDDLDNSEYVQTKMQMLDNPQLFTKIQNHLYKLMTLLEAVHTKEPLKKSEVPAAQGSADKIDHFSD